MIPGWLPSLILLLGTYRLCRLTGWDTFPPLARARAWAVGEEVVTRGSTNARLGQTNEQVQVDVTYRRPILEEGLHCAYCSSVWWGAIVYAGWRLEPSWTLAACFVLAVSAGCGLIGRWLDP